MTSEKEQPGGAGAQPGDGQVAGGETHNQMQFIMAGSASQTPFLADYFLSSFTDGHAAPTGLRRDPAGGAK